MLALASDKMADDRGEETVKSNVVGFPLSQLPTKTSAGRELSNRRLFPTSTWTLRCALRQRSTKMDFWFYKPANNQCVGTCSTSAESAAYAAECRKHEANDTKCQELGWTCIPLAVETFGHWGKEAQAVFSRLASFIAIHRTSPKSSVLNEIYSRLNMSLVRSVVRAILGLMRVA